MQNTVKQLTLAETIENVLFQSGLKAHFKQDSSEKGLARQENLDELINAASQFALETEGDVLAEFLANAALESGEDQADDVAGVQLMTLHSAKGLEFPVVFMGGMETGLFPHQMALQEAGRIEEERRLCYVGMTRAMQKLYLTHAQTRRVHGSERYRKPSRFLTEIPFELVEQLGSLTMVSRPVSMSEPKFVDDFAADELGLNVGQKVRHPKFGEGYVLNFEGMGEHARIQVKFRGFGSKWLVAAYAHLEPL